jgi:hypothetical protein
MINFESILGLWILFNEMEWTQYDNSDEILSQRERPNGEVSGGACVVSASSSPQTSLVASLGVEKRSWNNGLFRLQIVGLCFSIETETSTGGLYL